MFDRGVSFGFAAMMLVLAADDCGAADRLSLRLSRELRLQQRVSPYQMLAAVPTGTVTDVPAAAADLALKGEISLRFDIQKYEVQGNTLLKPEQIDALVAPFTGKQRDFGDIQRVVEALEGAYRVAGYSAVQVYLPEQELDRGIVTIRVIEARLKRIEVEGNQYFSAENIRRSLPALREGESPNARTISAAVGAANENPAKKVNVTLRSGDVEGEVDAKVEVTDESPKKFFASFDNTGNPQTGSFRLGLGFQHANIGDRDHALTLQYITSPEKIDKVSIYSAAYRLPVYRWGDSVDVFAAYSDVNAGTTSTPAGPLQFTGRGKIVGARYNWILPRQGGYEQRLIFALDYRAYLNACTIAGAALCGTGGADVTVHPIGVTYSGQLSRPSSQSTVSLAISHNLAGGAKGGSSDFDAARPTANAGYNVLRLNATHLTVHGSDWQSRIGVAAQHTSDALVPGEQFGLVGSNAVRGFLEREIANDRGYVANAELYTPDFGKHLPRRLSEANARALIFYDFGNVSRNNVQPGEVAGATASSLGVGLRVNYKKDVAFRADLAQVINEGTTLRGRSIRAHAAALLSF